MYTGKKGLYVLKDHVERFQSNGQNPWAFFSDYQLIEDVFGKLAREWVRQKRKEEMINFITRFATLKPFTETIAKNEVSFSNTELIKLNQDVVQTELGFKVDSSGKTISK